MKIFKKREKQEDLRKNIYLPIIENQKEMQKFAKKLVIVLEPNLLFLQTPLFLLMKKI